MTFPSDTPFINDPIREYQAKLRHTIQLTESLRPTLKCVQEAIQRADSKAIPVVRGKDPLFPKIELMLFIKNLDETIPLFRELAKEGIRTNKSQPYTDHHFVGAMGLRVYHLSNDVELNVIIIGPDDNDPEAGPKCRMVQTGVKEVPVYEVKCD